MRTPTLYHLIDLSSTLAQQLHYVKDHIQLHGNRPLGGSEEAHLWTPEEEQEANWMAERAVHRRPTAQHPDNQYLHIQGNRPAEQYAEGYEPQGDSYFHDARALPVSELADHRAELRGLAHGFQSRGRPVPDTVAHHLRTAERQLGRRIGTGYASRRGEPGSGNTFDYPTEIEPVDIGHPNVGQAFGHGLQARDMNRRNSAIGGRIKAHAQAAKRFRNAGDTFGLAPETLSPASRRKERRRAGQMPHFGDYYAGDEIPVGYAESPKDVSDFADRARRPMPRRRAARVLEHAAEENTRHGYGSHPAVMRMRDDARRQEREAEREAHPAPRYSRYSDSTSNPFHSISYGRQAQCGSIPYQRETDPVLVEIIDKIHHLCSLLES